MKSAKLEWSLGELKTALSFLEEGIHKYPNFPKLYMMKGQIETVLEQYLVARETYNQGVCIIHDCGVLVTCRKMLKLSEI